MRVWIAAVYFITDNGCLWVRKFDAVPQLAGSRPLAVAAHFHDAAVAQTLLVGGADPSARSRQPPPAHFGQPEPPHPIVTMAAMDGLLSMVQLLAAWGAYVCLYSSSPPSI